VLPAGLQIDHRAFFSKADSGESSASLLSRMRLLRQLSSAVSHGREQFFLQVRGVGIEPVAEIEFRDHHAYDGTTWNGFWRCLANLGLVAF